MSVTRIDSVRAATGSARDSVLHAAEVVAPYAQTARRRAGHYAREARVRLAPRMSVAVDRARARYDAQVAPRVGQVCAQARAHVPPKMDETAVRAGRMARQAAAVSWPRIEQAVAAAGPVSREATDRSAAALAALRGQVSAEEVRCLVRRRERRARASRVALGALAVGVLVGGAYAVWRWWDRQANPEWLIEPPAATEVPDDSARSAPQSAGNGGVTSLDPEVRAKQKDARRAERVARERRGAGESDEAREGEGEA